MLPCLSEAILRKLLQALVKSFVVEKPLVGAVGIEPTTFGLKGRCSTTELRPYDVILDCSMGLVRGTPLANSDRAAAIRVAYNAASRKQRRGRRCSGVVTKRRVWRGADACASTRS